jgi:hypothetical protein
MTTNRIGDGGDQRTSWENFPQVFEAGSRKMSRREFWSPAVRRLTDSFAPDRFVAPEWGLLYPCM